MDPQLIILLLLAGTVPIISFSISSDNVITPSIIHSYTIGNNDIIHEVRPKPRDPNFDVEEEDEVEMYYPTTRRSFMFPSSSSSSSNNKKDDSRIITIRETSFGCGKLGATVWPSAIALSCLLHGTSQDLIEDKRVIELGSGCGLPSSYCSIVARSVLATDYWEQVIEDEEKNNLYRNSAIGATTNNGDRLVPKNAFRDNLIYNIQQSRSDDDEEYHTTTNNVSVKRLDWHDEMNILKIASDYRPDTIIGSDLVYYPMDTRPLLQTLELLLKAGGAKNALLVLPLPPMAEREALPEFVRLLKDGELGDDCEVTMDEIEMKMIGRGKKDNVVMKNCINYFVYVYRVPSI